MIGKWREIGKDDNDGYKVNIISLIKHQQHGREKIIKKKFTETLKKKKKN